MNYWPQTNMEKVSKLKISHGQSLAAISSMMSQKNIISNQWVFEVITKLKGLDKSIQVGTFRFNSTHTNQDIINNLVFGRPDRKKITFLEGWNMKQVSEHLADVMKFEYDEVISLLKDENFISDLNINSKTLEGYLFPETYYFFEGVDKKTIIKRLVKEHFSFWNEENILKADELGFTPIEIVTLASIIEGEAIYDSERPIISAVYHNRLKKGMKLQADPTVQYIIKDGPRRLLNKDLRIKSLYNTYMYKGLPPGPINSPGLQSLLAALNPQINNYFYFVAKGDGYHTFSKNEKEHERAKRAFQRVRKKVNRQRTGS
ncbi:endolytic transglycosylase MltG [bacterium]|nr:endolytic transglycosylase MltG [bacterium]